MSLTVRFSSAAWWAGLLLALSAAAAPAQTKTGPAASRPAATPESAAADLLALEERQVADKFKRLEELLLRMAELSAATDPQRAALLRKVVAKSKEELIGVQLEAIVEMLAKEQLSRAIENQGEVDRELRGLLELMLSENRAKRLESEKARIREYLKRLASIINQQKGVQGRTAGGGDPKSLAQEQGRLAGRTGDLAKDIKANEEDANKPAGKPAGKQDGGGQPKEAPGKGNGKGQDGAKGQDGGKAKDDAKGQDAAGKKSDSQGGQKGPQQKGSQAKGQGQSQGQGQPQDQAPSEPQGQPDNPARKRLESAQQRMREAEEKLNQAQREGAAEKQEEAVRELEQAKAALEEILRQLREEEIERVLTALEARFTKMLQMQRAVLEGTVKLDKVPQAERTHNHEIEAGRLSGKEAEIDLEAAKALNLLREEGSAVAFPEAVGQMRQDIQQVVQRLSDAKVDKITQGIEEEIIAALEEMIKSLQQAIKDQEKKRQRPMPMPGEPQDPPLVDLLAEIKMIRALQMRVNTRTQRYSKMIQGEQAEQPDLVEAIRRLAERQERIYRITRDLHMGKNR